MSFARLELFGNLGSEPETRYTPNGQMNVQFSMAVNTRVKGEDVTTWYRVTAWGEEAERIDALVQKGSIQKGYSLIVFGRFLPRNYTANDGTERTSYDVTLDSFEFAGGGRREGNGESNGNGNHVTAPATTAGGASFSADDF